MTRTPDRVITLRSQLTRLNNLRQAITALELQLPKVHEAAALLAPDGHSPNRSADTVRAKGSHSDPTGESIAAFDEQIGEALVDIDEAIDGGFGTIKFAFDRTTDVTARIVPKANAEKVGQGWCRAHCGHWCAGTGDVKDLVYTDDDGKTVRRAGTKDDRLRDGLCNSCRMWSSRNGNPDLAELRRARRGNEGNCNCDDCTDQRDHQHQPKEVA